MISYVLLGKTEAAVEQEPDRLHQLIQLLVGESASTCPDAPLSHNHLSTLVITAPPVQLSSLRFFYFFSPYRKTIVKTGSEPPFYLHHYT